MSYSCVEFNKNVIRASSGSWWPRPRNESLIQKGHCVFASKNHVFWGQVIVQIGRTFCCLLLLIFKQNVRQIVYLTQSTKHSQTKPNRQILERLTVVMWLHVCVCVTYVHMDLCVYACVRAFNGMLISLIRQWVKQCGWDYWPACQPHWPLRWRPLKHGSLLVPKTLTAFFISATPSAPPAASVVIHPAIIKHMV